MAVSKTLLSPRGHSRQRGGKRRARAQPEPMDTEGVSFGARFALAGSVVARRLEKCRPLYPQTARYGGTAIELR